MFERERVCVRKRESVYVCKREKERELYLYAYIILILLEWISEGRFFKIKERER